MSSTGQLPASTVAHVVPANPATFVFDPADYQIFSDPGGETPEQFIQLNTQAAPFDDVDARRALAYATNKSEVIDVMTEGYNQPADGPYAPDSPWFAETDYPQFDPAKATELATKVRAAHGGEFRFTLMSSPDVATQQMSSNYVTLHEDGRGEFRSIPFRYAWPAEMDLMARIAGLRPEHRWDSWSRTPFTSESSKIIAVWQKA